MAPVDDLDRIMAVMEAAFDPAYGEAWTRRQVADILLFDSTFYCLLDEDGQVPAEGKSAAGFTLSRRLLDEEELLLIAVIPDARRKGLGKKLIDTLVSKARDNDIARIFLEMRAGNPAESLYRSAGFEAIGRRPNYYRGADGGRIDALTFSLIT